MATELKLFKVYVGNKYTHTIETSSRERAISMAWDDIAAPGYYKYGWASWEDFKNNVKVEEL